MSFDLLAQAITNQLVADLQTHRHLRTAWDQMDPGVRELLVEHWRALIVEVCEKDAPKIAERDLALGFRFERAFDAARDAVPAAISDDDAYANALVNRVIARCPICQNVWYSTEPVGKKCPYIGCDGIVERAGL